MSKHYWMTFCNDRVELFGTECQTRTEAINELKKAFLFDHGESPSAATHNDYFIEEYFESPNLIVVGKTEYFKMTIGPRGGVRAQKTREI